MSTVKARPMGLMKNKTFILVKYKEEVQEKKARVQRSKDGKRNSINQKKSPLIENNEPVKQLPPQWVDIYEDTLDKLKQVKDLSMLLDILKNEIRSTVNSSVIQKNYDAIRRYQQTRLTNIRDKLKGDISNLLKAIYKKVIACEQNIERITQAGNLLDETQNEKKIRTNIQKALAQQIQESANSMRSQQKKMISMIKHLETGSSGDFLKLSNEKQAEMSSGDSQLQVDMLDDMSRERDEEINRLVDMINDLAHVFKSLNQLVIDQGTVLDRIDYNIDQTFQNVKKANVKLREADKSQNSPLARRCILILLLLIFIFSVLLTYKYSKQ